MRMTPKEKTTMHRFGSGYVVVSWDASVQCGRESAPMSYWFAREAVAEENCPATTGKGVCRHVREHRQTR